MRLVRTWMWEGGSRCRRGLGSGVGACNLCLRGVRE